MRRTDKSEMLFQMEMLGMKGKFNFPEIRFSEDVKKRSMAAALFVDFEARGQIKRQRR